MTPDERQMLAGLFERTRAAADAPRDREAEAMIADAVHQQPYAPYLLAQTVLVQEEALKAAGSRIQELETQLRDAQAQAGGAPRQEEGSFLGGLGKTIFGSAPAGQRPSSVPRTGASAWNQPEPPPQRGPWGAAPGFGGGGGGFGGGAFGGAPGGGGGFLRGALTTAAGVAGGALLFQGISSLFSGAHAASPLAQSMADPAALSGTEGINDTFDKLPGAEGETAAQAASADTSADDDGAVDDADYDDASYDDGDAGGYDDGGGDDGGDWA